jgi:hypothetical protein
MFRAFAACRAVFALVVMPVHGALGENTDHRQTGTQKLQKMPAPLRLPATQAGGLHY